MQKSFVPLAARLRPISLEEFYGQAHLLAPSKPLRRAIESGQLHSMILWGPPGTGKTTLAKLMAQQTHAEFMCLSAVLDGVKEIRLAVEKAKQLQIDEQRATILFVDEVHRFNKAQQDAFLPFVEEGTITFIGATTENPSFELIGALLSRTRVYVLKRLLPDDILCIIDRALTDNQRGLGKLHLNFPQPCRELLAHAADGDARRALNLLEIISDLDEPITEPLVQEICRQGTRRFDKNGEVFYDQISALHKAVRGSAPDAALYWFARMIDGGCDPLYIARRVARMATEDIGNADPRALQIALQAWDIQQRLGSPEGELAIAQAIVYMACAAKSNAIYTAYQAAMADAQYYGSLEVPLHLRNAPTRLMKNSGYGKNYRYAHDEANAYAAGENYFPEQLAPRIYYHPVSRGLEIQIAEKLAKLRGLDKAYHEKNK